MAWTKNRLREQHHRVMIQGRHSGTISGVSDVLSFGLNEIVTPDDTGDADDTRTGASYESADTGKKAKWISRERLTALFIPNRKARTEKIPPFLDGCSGNAHGDRSRGPLFVLAFAKGAGIMLGYDILRAFRRGFPHGAGLSQQKTFYWVFAWIFVF